MTRTGLVRAVQTRSPPLRSAKLAQCSGLPAIPGRDPCPRLGGGSIVDQNAGSAPRDLLSRIAHCFVCWVARQYGHPPSVSLMMPGGAKRTPPSVCIANANERCFGSDCSIVLFEDGLERQNQNQTGRSCVPQHHKAPHGLREEPPTPPPFESLQSPQTSGTRLRAPADQSP